MHTFTDSELVSRTLKNPDNYVDIIDTFQDAIIRYLRRLTGVSDEEVDELAQIVFIKAYRSLHSFDLDLKLSSWIYRIAHNVAVDFLRKTTKKHTFSLDADDDQSLALIEKIAAKEDVALSFSRDAAQDAVRQIISLLPEKYKTVIILYFLEEKSYEEISDILQIPVNTVGTLLHRAKQHFIALTTEPKFSHLFSYVSS